MAVVPSSDDLLFFNGIDGATGEYGLPPMTGEELSRFVQGESSPDNLSELGYRHRQAQEGRHFGVREGVDPKKLDQAGWGVIFTHDADPAIREALAPLLDLRREQAGENFRIYRQADGYRPGEAKSKFLARHGAGPGPADPATVPYYLLLVGSPEEIPYRFQSQLDVQYAVGRIHFDEVEDYARYAGTVVAAETGPARRPRKVGLLGVENPDDKATRLSARHLVSPLAQYLRAHRDDWRIDAFLKEDATKARLASLLGGPATPSLLVTASHGMEFRNGDRHQLPHQGALLCSDWPGPQAWRGQGAIPQDFYLAGDDLAADADLLGLVSFHFACYGAGTPREDEFAKQAFRDQRAAIAPHAFLAALPTALLAHPRGGALAVVGHVERAWGYSFLWKGAGRQTAVFESTLDRLLDGHPVGSALEFFNERYAELSTMLADQLEEADFGAEVDPYELAGMWTANNDARGYVVIGDPAVRLAADDETNDDAVAVEATDRPAPPVRKSPPTKRAAEGEEAADPGDAGYALGDEDSASVRFSAYHPSAVHLGERRPLLVYAHLGEARAAVAADAGQVLGKQEKDYRQAEAEASAALAAGTEVTVVPAGDGLVFDPPQARIVWSGTWQRARFEMAATGERVGHVIEGSIAFYVGPLLVADLRLPVVVPAAGEDVDDGEPVHGSARMYQAVFASYSHADTAVVETMETACKALGMDYLRDVMTLKSGQSWSDELLAMVERADVFQLFWSETAADSPYVEQEWRHALGLVPRKSPAFIRPIYWQKPLAPVPADLAHLHFAPVDLGALVGSSAGVVATVTQAVTSTVALPGDAEDLATLTVSTYTATDPDRPGATVLRARTRVSLAGDVETHLAEDASEAVLSVHAETCREALRARLAYLELLARGRQE